MPIFKKRHIPFGEQSRHYRNNAYIEIKNLIRRDAPILGGLFTTHDYMHGKNGWIDGFFLGRRAPNFYNFVLDTTRNVYKEDVRDLASDRSYELVADCEPGIFDNVVKDRKTGMWTSKPTTPKQFDQFGGLSRYQWVEQQIPIIAREKAIQVFENWTLHHDYRFGIGLHATIDVPYLTIEAVNDFIRRFLETEVAYLSKTPLCYLPEDLENWGVESNAVLQPNQWHI